ncbi:MAG TPA: helix-turn-helix domain-containing protein, partial [Pseudomonadota bacterium]|nr:helix-turn-helix domain-containing protein [Pseudomonadota bacterium]
LERAVLMGQGDRVESLEFGLGDATLGSSAALAAGGEAAAPGDDLDLDRAEERMVRRALERSEGNVQRAAELLGLSRAALYRRFEKFGIQV